MRIRLKAEFGPAGRTPLTVGKWYPASKAQHGDNTYRVDTGSGQVDVPAFSVEERAVADDAWEDLGFGALPLHKPGEQVKMVKRRLECPEGHRRELSQEDERSARTDLTCTNCAKAYTSPSRDDS